MRKENIAIIGMGISGCAVLAAYATGKTPHQITCLAPEESFGYGLPFAPDSEEALMNTRSIDLSAYPNRPSHYATWLEEKLGDVPAYTSRPLFGRYLREQAFHLLKISKAQWVKAKVTGFHFDHPTATYQCTWVKNGIKQVGIFDRVHLCTGEVPHLDPYQLVGSPQYLSQPYPLKTWPKEITASSRLAIIGTSLSAIDAIKYAAKVRQVEQITAFSRGGYFPILGQDDAQADVTFKFLTPAHFDSLLAAHQGHLPHTALNEALLAECTHCALNINKLRKSVLQAGLRPKASPKALRQDLLTFEAIATQMTRLLNHYWPFCYRKDREAFQAKYQRLFDLVKGKQPQTSVDCLLQAQEDGQLTLSTAVAAIEQSPQADTFQLKNTAGAVLQEVDWVINATGWDFSFENLGANEPLLAALFNQHLAQVDPAGGLSIYAPTQEIISPVYGRLPRCHAHGNLVSGALYQTNSIGGIQLLAQKVIQHTKP